MRSSGQTGNSGLEVFHGHEDHGGHSGELPAMQVQGAPETGQGTGYQSDYELLLLESRNRVRLAAADKLMPEAQEGDVVQGLAITLQDLKHGVPLLLDATVEDEDFPSVLMPCRKRLGRRAGQFPLYPGVVP